MDNATLEVFRLSAQMCGYEHKTVEGAVGVTRIYATYPGNPKSDWREWNPFTNPAQRDECRRELLKRGDIFYSNGGTHRFWRTANRVSPTVEMSCSVNEFDARALAEIGRAK